MQMRRWIALAAEAELNEEEDDDEPEDLATLANMGMDAAEEDWCTQVEEPEPVTKKVSKPTRVAKQESLECKRNLRTA